MDTLKSSGLASYRSASLSKPSLATNQGKQVPTLITSGCVYSEDQSDQGSEYKEAPYPNQKPTACHLAILRKSLWLQGGAEGARQNQQ